MKIETRRNRRRQRIITIALGIISEDWIPTRRLVSTINEQLPNHQEITIHSLGNLISGLVSQGVIERKSTKLLGRNEVQYRIASNQ